MIDLRTFVIGNLDPKYKDFEFEDEFLSFWYARKLGFIFEESN